MISPTVNTFPRPQKRRHGLGCIAWSLLILRPIAAWPEYGLAICNPPATP